MAISQLPHPLPRKVTEQILDTISKHREDKDMTETHQNGYTKGKSHLTNLTPLWDERTVSVAEGKGGLLYTLTSCQRPC